MSKKRLTQEERDNIACDRGLMAIVPPEESSPFIVSAETMEWMIDMVGKPRQKSQHRLEAEARYYAETKNAIRIP